MMLFAEDAPIFTSLLDATMPARSDDVLFCYQDQTVGLTDNKAIPSFGAFSGQVPPESLYCFGEIETGQKCFFTEILPETLQFTEIRPCLLDFPTQLRQAVVIGGYLYRWRRLNTYCGQCKAEMEDSRIERARLCPACGNIVYPRISPCIIVLVTRGDEILLARSPHFRPRIFSTLAGFINIGETVEHAVHREVREEVGIEIADLVYQGSQPWLFPDSLMLAFTAKYVSGEIQIDGNEIEAAAWFHRDALPDLPTGISIARCLIDDYLNYK